MLHEICRKSFMRKAAIDSFWGPLEVAAALRSQGGLVFLDTGGASTGSCARSFVAADPSEMLRGHIDRDWALVSQVLEERQGSAGGLFGWVGYDGHFTFGVYPHVMVFHHQDQSWSESGALSQRLVPDAAVLPAPPSLAFRPLVTRAAFVESVRQAQNYIAAGDVYQVNLAHPWQASWPLEADALALYARLRKVSPAPYSAFAELDGTCVISSSLESFLHMQGRTITTRPIKGTRPRFPHDEVKDRQSAHELAQSPKERAELLMITDLLRNDLGMVCDYGSICVPDLARVESFAQVFHLVSTVTGTLRQRIDHAAAFQACFPGGSITGAPKKRAREIIAELEPHPRGMYTGALGYFGFDGESEFNIIIRTAVQQEGRIVFHAGAGIVADSVPELEHEETLHKASGLLRTAL
ncbi:MAG: hypothetical protein JWO94_356 [Verrucomicrobiaceae bacterium]|nr:hypothetical protein [Verrucomicrobiaceae bacterium]